MFLPGGQFRILPVSDFCQRFLHGNGVLPRVLHPRNPADRVAVSLADAAAPEGVILPVRQDDIRIQPGQREQAGVPARADDRRMGMHKRRPVHVGKVLRHPRVGIEGIHHVEQLRQPGRHFRQVRSAAAADDHRVDHPGILFRFLRRVDRRPGQRLHRLRIAPRKDAEQFHVRILADRQFHAPAQVPVSVNSDFHLARPPVLLIVPPANLSYHTFPPVFRQGTRPPSGFPPRTRRG